MATSSCPAWTGEDFSACFRTKVIDGIIPLVIAIFSFVCLIYPLLQALSHSRESKDSKSSKRSYAAVASNPDSAKDAIWNAENAVFLEEVQRNGFVWSDMKNTPVMRTTYREISASIKSIRKRGFFSVLASVLRDVLVIAAAGTLVAFLVLRAIHTDKDFEGSRWIWVAPALWGYYIVLAFFRMVLALRQKVDNIYELLEWHIVGFEIVYSCLASLNMRSTYISQVSHSALTVEYVIFGLSWFITLVELFAPRRSAFIPIASATGEGEYSPLLGKYNSPTSTLCDEKIGANSNPAPPELGASLFSLGLFTFFENYIFKHARTTAKPEDVPRLRPDDHAAPTVLAYRADAERCPKFFGHEPTFAWKLVYAMRRHLILQQIWALTTPFLSVVPSMFIAKLLTWITLRANGEVVHVHVAILYLTAIIASMVALSIANCQTLIIGRRMCIQIRSIIISETFTKALRRKDAESSTPEKEDGEAGETKVAEEGRASAGKINNLISVDAYRVSELCAYVHFFWPQAPLTIIFATILLVKLLGWSAVATIATMLLLIPIQTWLAKAYLDAQSAVLLAADDRLSVTTEAIQAIKVLKFFAWEERFQAKMAGPRMQELKALTRRMLVFSGTGLLMFGTPIVIALVTFLFHTKVLGRNLDATTAFTSLSLFNVIRTPLDTLSDMASNALTAWVSARRLAAFLAEEETSKYTVLSTPARVGDPKIGFKNATLSWVGANNANAAHAFKLGKLDLEFPEGELSLVVGPVGSGKTSLLHALLGEMNLLSGRTFLASPVSRDISIDPSVRLTDTTALATQQPWLINDTIKGNILFGAPYNPARYQEVLRACALLPDIAVFPLGDLTEVGEKGTVCSGGQKARIALARALYSPAKTLLLDDILSAVDAETARHLYTNCIAGGSHLTKGRTRILVTHSTKLCLPAAEYLVQLRRGVVEYAGAASDAPAAIETGQTTPTQSTVLLPTPEVSVNSAASLAAHSIRSDNSKPELDISGSAISFSRDVNDSKIDPIRPAPPPKLIEEEAQSTGSVSLAVYALWVKAFGGTSAWIWAMLFFIVAEVGGVANNWALRLWAASYDNKQVSADGPGSHSSDYYLSMYVILAVISLIFYGIRMLFFLWRGVKASQTIYEKLIWSILHAPVRFFDQTPLGRITNRLSRDAQTVDQDVAMSVMFFILEVFGTISTVIAIAFAVPKFLIAAVFITAVWVVVGWLYISTSRELKRMDSTSRSPIFSTLGEAVAGVVTIRAYGDSTRFAQKIITQIDKNAEPFYSLWCANRWLALRSEFGGAATTLAAAAFVIASKRIDAGLAGFILTYCLLFQEKILWVVRMYASLEINLNSIERCDEYIRLPQEPQDGALPPAYWPSRNGTIEIENLSASYAPGLPLVLKDLTLTIKPGEKVGIVGRTGSGKSTLALSFFRFISASQGRIIIDGLDISKVKLHELRSRLTILPQDATLFSGTIRFNMDPFDQHSDIEVWDSLHRAGLSAEQGITSLDQEVLENGKNFSRGQAQLLAIARGLLKLKTSNLCVLDEASASLDSATDDFIQNTIRNEMKDATILCIAHRLRTVIDYDKILVLGHGELLEYDTPGRLLAKKNSVFSQLVRESGEETELRSMVKV